MHKKPRQRRATSWPQDAKNKDPAHDAGTHKLSTSSPAEARHRLGTAEERYGKQRKLMRHIWRGVEALQR